MKSILLQLASEMERRDPPVSIQLDGPATIDQIEESESKTGLEFPVELREFFLQNNGQRAISQGAWHYYECDQFIPAISFRSLGYREANSSYRTATGWMHSVGIMANDTNLLKQQIKDDLSDEKFEIFGPTSLHSKYISLLQTENANTLVLDLEPVSGGTLGQVVSLDTSAFTLCVIANSLTAFLELIVKGFLSGRYTRESEDMIWVEKQEERA